MKTILIVYHSQEMGNTKKMAELVAEGCRLVEGVSVNLLNVNERRADMDVVEKADAYAIGTPDYFSYPAGEIKQFFDDLLIAHNAGRKVQAKPCALFLTHGGGGKAVGPLENLARALKLQNVAETLSCKGAPAGDEAEKARSLGKGLAEHVVATA